MRRLLATILTAALLLTATACADAGSTETSSAGDGGTSSGGAAADSQEKVTLRIMAPRGPGDFPDDGDENHNFFVDYLRDNTPYDFEYTFFIQDDPENRNVLIASGQEFDIIGWPSDYAADLPKLLSSGYLAMVDDYLDLAPTAVAQVPELLWKAVTIDGGRFSLPMPNNSGNLGLTIRTDWLEKVGKTMPTTMEELKDVLAAFRDGDPDGNGKNDTVPLTGFTTDELSRLFRAYFGIQPDFAAKDGKVEYTLATETGREMMAMMHDWYGEGLIDAELPTMKRDIFLQRMGGDIAGSGTCWWWMKKTIDRTLTENHGVGDILESPLRWVDPILKNRDGQPMQFDPAEPVQLYLVFPAGGNTEAAMKFVEMAVTDPIADVLNFGLEDLHWQRTEDGGREFLPAYDDAIYRWHYCDNLAFNFEKMVESENMEYGPWRAPVQTWTGGLELRNAWNLVPPIESVSQQYQDLFEFRRTSVVAFMMGERPMSEYDAFIEELNTKYAVPEICDAIAQAYYA